VVAFAASSPQSQVAPLIQFLLHHFSPCCVDAVISLIHFSLLLFACKAYFARNYALERIQDACFFQHFHKRRCWSILIFSNIFKIYYNNIIFTNCVCRFKRNIAEIGKNERSNQNDTLILGTTNKITTKIQFNSV
jgi:hypothetical protein